MSLTPKRLYVVEIFHNGKTHCICRPFEEFKKLSSHPAFTFKLEYEIPKVEFHWWNPRETNGIESNKQVIETFVTKLLHDEKYLRDPQIISLLGLNGENHFDVSVIENINFVETAKRARKHYILFDTDEEMKQFAIDLCNRTVMMVLLGLLLIGSTLVSLFS